jgi:hypothetical protein
MKQINYSMIPSEVLSATKSLQTIGSMLGHKPERSRSVVTLYPELTISSITEALGKVHSKNVTQKDRFTPIKSLSFEWLIKTHMIPKIEIVANCNATGQNREEFAIVLKEKYYDKGDTFRLENDQKLFVRHTPERLSQNQWKYRVTLTGNDLKRRLDTRFTQKGKTTTYLSNYHPELSERGYNKFMYNIESMTNYISRHRQSDSWSSDFAVLDKVYFQHAGEYFEMDSIDKQLMDLYFLSRENNLLFGESNHDIAGKCLDQDERGRDIPMGDGTITQFQKHCSQQRYNNFHRSLMRDAIEDVTSKTEKETGNTIVVMCNKRMYSQFQDWADKELKERATDGYFYTKEGKEIKLGATYKAYEWMGNTIVFTINRALSEYYKDQGYGVFFDAGQYGGIDNIEMMTLSGRLLISGTIAGMGGLSGTESGPITTSVDGSEKHLLGYSGVKVANPYAGHIIKENLVF